MATTHMLVGMSLAVPFLLVAPEFAAIALLAGLLGGLIPDLDLYVHHRRALHFPVVYPILAASSIGIAALFPSAWTVGLAVGLTAAAAHSIMDVFGGGLELKPWRATSEKGVYSHVHDRWLRPRRWVRYDGSPEDFALATVVALPLLLTLDGIGLLLVLGLLGISVVYAVLRRSLAALAETLINYVPRTLRLYVPERYGATK